MEFIKSGLMVSQISDIKSELELCLSQMTHPVPFTNDPPQISYGLFALKQLKKCDCLSEPHGEAVSTVQHVARDGPGHPHQEHGP